MRHRFEPVRLVLGLWLIALAGVHLARVASADDGAEPPPREAMVALLLAGALAAVVVGLATHLLRRRAGRHKQGPG